MAVTDDEPEGEQAHEHAWTTDRTAGDQAYQSCACGETRVKTVRVGL